MVIYKVEFVNGIEQILRYGENVMFLPTGYRIFTGFKLKRYDNNDSFMYEETYTLLDYIDEEYRELTVQEFSHLQVFTVQGRFEALLEKLSVEIGFAVDDIIYLNEYITEDSEIYLPGQHRVSETLKVESTLLQTTDDAAELLVSFDELDFNNTPYLLMFFLLTPELVIEKVDYFPGVQGELFYKTSKEKWELVFDINDQGELIVIGPDADRFSIDENGELMYTGDLKSSVWAFLSDNEMTPYEDIDGKGFVVRK